MASHDHQKLYDSMLTDRKTLGAGLAKVGLICAIAVSITLLGLAALLL